MKNYLKKFKISRRKKVFTKEETETAQEGTTRIRKYLAYCIIIVCVSLFYSHQFFPDIKDDADYFLAKKNFIEAKKRNTDALTKIKNAVKGTELHNSYLKINKEKNEAYSKWEEVASSKKVFGFKSMRYFIERFGLTLCFFIYALYNLIKSFLRERKNIGAKILHTLILSLCFFSFYWIFQKFQDFNRLTYYLMTLVSASTVTLAVYLITKYNKDRITKLREQMFKISIHAYRNAKPEKKSETFKMLKKIAHEK
ncbi:conserved membrane hypothetical protein [Tenacibaculum sp. 190524A02b]|uniref:Uncharacterized protein n=1 Tax=Tenacibaculum vairaonense TaxID=3137860 RepID=A0ABM9PLU1_9FLAO